MSRAPRLLALALGALTACATGGASDDAIDAATGGPDARAIDGAVPVDAADPDAAATDAAATDAAATDAAATDARIIDATPIDGAAIDATPIDAPAGTVPDTCAQAQNLTAAALGPTGVTVAGNTTGAIDDVNPASSCTGYAPDGPDHIYVVNLTAGQTVTATATPTTSWDISLELVTPCTTTPTCLDGSDSGLSGGAETASYAATGAQIVFVVVDGYNPGVAGPYSLLVRIQ